jgi:hypothetical protein
MASPERPVAPPYPTPPPKFWISDARDVMLSRRVGCPQRNR